MLFPAFQMQLTLQRKVLGTRFWEAESTRRAHMKVRRGVGGVMGTAVDGCEPANGPTWKDICASLTKLQEEEAGRVLHVKPKKVGLRSKPAIWQMFSTVHTAHCFQLHACISEYS